ncbi:MAG: hypothetical protein IIU80_04605 [Clostridia bacterium]|nr:hypothetical protein [Clostridia bacterium]
MKKIKLNKQSKLIVSVLLAVAAVLLIVFTAAQSLGNMTVSSMADSVKSYFLSLGAGDGFPYELDSASVKDIKINNSNIYLLTSSKTTVLNQTAKEIMPKEHSYSKPAMKSKGARFIVYDLDSARYRIQNGSDITREGEAKGRIIAAALGKSGNYALATYSDSVQSVLTVYNSGGKELYVWNFKSERVIDISLSDNGKFAAVATVDAFNGEINSKVYVFSFKSDKAVSEFDYKGTAVVKVDYVKGTNIIVMGDNIRSYIKNNSKRKDDISFGSDILYKYCITDTGRSAVVLSQYSSTSLSKLSVYSGSGKDQFTVSFNKEMKWADCDDKYTAVLFENEVRTFNKKGKQIGSISFTGEPVRVAVDGSRTYVLTTSGLQCYDTRGTD